MTHMVDGGIYRNDGLFLLWNVNEHHVDSEKIFKCLVK